jgi:hypothetical protein
MMVGKKILSILLLMLNIMLMIQPVFIPTILAYSNEISRQTRNTNLASTGSSQAPYIYGFNTILTKCTSISKNSVSYSGGVISITPDAKKIFAVIDNKVYIIDISSGGVAQPTTLLAKFDTNTIPNGQIVSFSNNAFLVAPSGTNPYIINLDGKATQLQIYDANTLFGMISYQIVKYQNYYAWANSKGAIFFSISDPSNPQPFIIWRYDLFSNGGARTVATFDSVTAVVSQDNVLYLFDKNRITLGYSPLVNKINGVYAVANAKSGFFIAKDTGSGSIGIYYLDTSLSTTASLSMSGQPINLRGVVSSMVSYTDTYYEDLFVVTPGGLLILIVDPSTHTNVLNQQFLPVPISGVSVFEYSGVVYFITTGSNTLVGHIDSKSIIIDGLKSNPYPTVAAYVVPGNPSLTVSFNLSSGRTMTVSMPPNSMLLGEIISKGGCISATLYVPVQILTGPHIEVSGTATAQFYSGTDNLTAIKITGIIPYGINMKVDSISFRRLYASLTQPGLDPVPMSYNTNYNDTFWGLGIMQWIAAESNSVWQFSVTNGIPRANFEYKATWHHPPPFTPQGSFPAASIGIWYYNIVPTPINQYEKFSIHATITSTNVILDAPGWFQSGSWVYGADALIHLASAIAGSKIGIRVIKVAKASKAAATTPSVVHVAGGSSDDFWLTSIIPSSMVSKITNNTDKYNAIKNSLNEQAYKQSNIMATHINNLYKNGLITNYTRDVALAGIGSSLGQPTVPLDDMYYYYTEAMQYAHTDIVVNGVVSINTGGTSSGGTGSSALDVKNNLFIAKALSAGLSTSDIGQILKLSIEDTIRAQYYAAFSTLSSEECIGAEIGALSYILNYLKELAQKNQLYMNISGQRIQLTPSDIDAYIDTFLNSVARHANASATLFTLASGMQTTNPMPSMDTLYYIYMWSKGAMRYLGVSDANASVVGLIFMNSALLASMYDASLALQSSLKNRGINIGINAAYEFSAGVLESATTIAHINLAKDRINEAYAPKPELIAEFFEKYASEYILSKQTSQTSQSVEAKAMKLEAIKELADMIRNAKVVVVPPGEDPNKYIAQGNEVRFVQITWQTKAVKVKPEGIADFWSIEGGTQALLDFISLSLFIIGALVAFAAPPVGAALIGASIMIQGVLAIQAFIYGLVTTDSSRGGMATLRGFVFDVVSSKQPNSNIGIFILDPLPSAIAYKTLFSGDVKVSECFRRVIEEHPEKFGYSKTVVYFSDIGNGDFDIKGIIRMYTNDPAAIIKRVGVVLVPVGWIQPPPGVDVSVDAEGFMQIDNFDFYGVIETPMDLDVNAGLTPQLWSQIKIAAYHVDSLGGKQEIGEFYLFKIANKTTNDLNLYKNGVFVPGGMLVGVNEIDIKIPASLATYTARFTLTINGTIVAPINGTQQPYKAIVFYTGEASFKPTRLGIYNLDQLPGYPANTYLAGIQVGIGTSMIPTGSPAMDYYMVIGDPIKKASVGNSPYNYLFTSDMGKLFPYGGTYFYAIYWLYYKIQQMITCDDSAAPSNPFDNKNIKLVVSPVSNRTVLPTWLDVAPGDLGLAVYVNGTESHSTLPRMTTTYIYTKEPTIVNVQTEFVADIERNDPKNHSNAGWFPYYVRTLYNVTFMTPGSKCQVALNYWIKNFTDYIVDQSRKLNATFNIYTRAKAVRLDNGVKKEARSPPTSVFPFIQGNLTTSTPKILIRVYDAINNTPISNATVKLHGNITISGLTNSTGYFNTTVPAGRYILSVNKTGYNMYTDDLYLMMDTMMNVPLTPIGFNNASNGWLIVFVRTIDGVPLEGASVYVNGTFFGTTDTNGQWSLLFKLHTNQTIKLVYGNWSETRTVNISSGRVLTTFTANVYSKIFTPMVYAYTVYTQPRVYANYSVIIEGGVITNSNNTYTVEVGIKTLDGKIIAKKSFTQTVTGPGTHPFIMYFDAPPDKGLYKPYMNITWAKKDNSYVDNYAEGKPFNVVNLMFLTLSIQLSVINWGKFVLGLIYPGDTKFNVTLESWLTDSALANMNYNEWLAMRRGQQVKLNSTMNMEIDVMAGTTSFVTLYSKTVSVSSLKYGTSVLFNDTVPAPFARFLLIKLSLPNLGNITIGNSTLMNATIISSDSGDIVLKFSGYKFKLPPHIIVKGIDKNSLAPLIPGNNMSASLRIWTNYLPGEGTHAIILLGFRMQDNTTLVGLSSAPAPEIHEGEQTIKFKIIVPSDLKYNFSWFEPFKKFIAIFTVAQAPDSYPDDNFAKTDITVLNNDSFVTWLLIGMGVITALIIILAFIHAIRGRSLARVIMSEWFERVTEKTIPSRSVHRRRENNLFNLEWFERINKDEEK